MLASLKQEKFMWLALIKTKKKRGEKKQKKDKFKS